VNNAGIAEGAPFTDTSYDLWTRTLGINLTGPFLCMQQVVPDMVKAKAGRIVNVASISGLKAFQTVSAYTASKHGLVGLTKVVALELAKSGVTVNAVCPAYTGTDMASYAIESIVKSGKTEEEALKMIVRTIPRGTLITPEEVAETIVFLCSDEASGITGESVMVAGGGGL
jgi:NAD(P)-dependent dehydrogenase (short-subunit alcohol dehydrogenase family)